jgi:hypothetical protein
MRDAHRKWWDVSANPENLISFPEIKIWKTQPASHRAERDALSAILPRFGTHATAHDAPQKTAELKVKPTPKLKPKLKPTAASRPDILWIISDDHRPDSWPVSIAPLAASPTAHLATYTRPSPIAWRVAARSSARPTATPPAVLHRGPPCIPAAIPFRNGIYGFEKAHDKAAFCKPTISQVMRGAGYHIMEIGKHGYRINAWGPGLTWNIEDQYDFRIDAKSDLRAQGKTDYFPNSPWKAANS